MSPLLQQIAAYFLARRNAAEFSPQSLDASLLAHLFVLEIERASGAHVSGLRIRLVGTALDRAFGRPLVGQKLETFIHGPRSEGVLGAFRHCATTREPVWMRQVVPIRGRQPRCVEGVAIYQAPERIYGGLIVGEADDSLETEAFQYKVLTGGLSVF